MDQRLFCFPEIYLARVFNLKKFYRPHQTEPEYYLKSRRILNKSDPKK
jgi:hypothetical protein